MRQSFEEFLRNKHKESGSQHKYETWITLRRPDWFIGYAEEWSSQQQQTNESVDKKSKINGCEDKAIQQPEDEVVDSLRLILPLAKGYVANNRVGSNDKYIEQAESILKGLKGEK